MNIKKYFITLGIASVALIVILGIIFFSVYSALGGKLTLGDMGELLLNQQLPGKTAVLLMGTDGGETRADVMIVAMLDPVSKKVDMISIPRDTRVYISGYYYKINATLGMKAKEQMCISEAKKLLGVNIDHFVRINFKGFRNTIDILGGVQFNVPRDMFYEDPTQDLYINLKKGEQLLDGKKAEQLVRFRRYAEGDVDRIRMQQAFLQEAFKQKLNPSIIAKAPALLDEISKNLKTDISASDYPKYINMFTKLSKDDLVLHETPGAGKYIDGVSYFIPDTKKLREMMQEIKTGATPSPSPSSKSSAKQTP